VSGANFIFTNNCLGGFSNVEDPENRRFWIYQNLERTARFQRRTGGYLTSSDCFFGPSVIHFLNGCLIFLRIVIMNLKNCHDTQQGFVQFIIPAPQWSTPLVSHRSSQDSTKTSSLIFTSKFGRAANLQDSQITKVAVIRNRLLKLVASTLGGRFTHVKPMVPCPTPTYV